MCDASGKLIAWMDGELPALEAAEVEQHLEVCAECRSHVAKYKRVSGEFGAFCDTAMASSPRGGVPRWVPVVASAGAVAALLALLLAWPRTPVEPLRMHPVLTSASASPIVVAENSPAPRSPVRKVHQRKTAAPEQIQNALARTVENQNAYSLPNEPMIQIAIPVDEMFPPGAVPEGMHFVADVSIAPDGSAASLRLRPRLTGFERRTTQP